jgi:hypothetical protein
MKTFALLLLCFIGSVQAKDIGKVISASSKSGAAEIKRALANASSGLIVFFAGMLAMATE